MAGREYRRTDGTKVKLPERDENTRYVVRRHTYEDGSYGYHVWDTLLDTQASETFPGKDRYACLDRCMFLNDPDVFISYERAFLKKR